MVDMNAIIANNILSCLKKQNKKQIDLAEAIGTTKQTVHKMLNGSRMINAIELKKIADYFGVIMDELVRIPEEMPESNVVRAFMGKVSSSEARNALKIADELSDMILFHRRVRENGSVMMDSWGED